MATADTIREQALLLARSGNERDEAVDLLEAACGGRRVSAVLARQQIASSLDDDPDQPDGRVAVDLLDALLERLPA